jgi:hypothetical protein
MFHQRGDRMPPPLKAELRPPSPGGDVDWIAGYWLWSEDLDDFVWIAGTYVVRAPPVVAVVPPAPAPAPIATPAPVVAPALPPPAPAVDTPREVSVTVPAAPPPRIEVIAPPPRLVGALWIAGHWELVGATWRWTPGRWVQPPRAGERFRAPTLQLRGNLRVYLPGRWIRVR